jgi:hypothetical protein
MTEVRLFCVSESNGSDFWTFWPNFSPVSWRRKFEVGALGIISIIGKANFLAKTRTSYGNWLRQLSKTELGIAIRSDTSLLCHL